MHQLYVIEHTLYYIGFFLLVQKFQHGFLLFTNAFLAVTSHFLPIVIFLCRFVPPCVSLSVLCTRKLCLLKSLFLEKKLIGIDSIIPHNFHFAQCLLHWMGGGGGGGGKHCAGGSKGIAPASFDQGLVSFWVCP
jgi:hypothetical protein